MFVIPLKKYRKTGYNLKRYATRWVEQYLFFPNILQRAISISLFPLTIAYCLYSAYKRILAKPKGYDIPVISIGNLVIGGTGKTPVSIALAKDRKKVAIILRGYGREFKGLFVVSDNGKIKGNISNSGDEAILLANSLPKATIIVSENRVDGIKKAKELGAKLIILDDGYNQHHIAKVNILIRPKIDPTNVFCLPSGGYRDTPMVYAFTDIVLRDGTDFQREVSFKQNNKKLDTLPKNVILLTAISKPDRLFEFLPKDIKMISYPDHYNYTQKDIDTIIKKYPEHTILTTGKDMVKLIEFNIKNIILIDLDISIDNKIIKKIEEYIKY
ncbi:MAG: tetraacyldisaccharide 4'-kinase [Campylobacterota bacterium]|nr:tetraacyldisaccharide 4'-kinase [Campylobacterota bacterium]